MSAAFSATWTPSLSDVWAHIQQDVSPSFHESSRSRAFIGLTLLRLSAARRGGRSPWTRHGEEAGRAWVQQVGGMIPGMARITVRPERVAILDFETRFPSALSS